MNVIEQLEINGKLVAKRCKESYLQRVGLYDKIIESAPTDFLTLSHKIKYLKYGGGYCLTCGIRTNEDKDGQGFESYCKEHRPKREYRPAHNRAYVDGAKLKDLYLNQKKSVLACSKILGVSHVTLHKEMIRLGIEQRSLSERSKLCSTTKGIKKPIIQIDRSELVDAYVNKRVPVTILAKKHKCNDETIRRFLRQEGIENLFHRRSSIEYVISEILDKNNIKYLTNRRSLITPYEIDFYLPDYNLGIEANGIYHHTIYSGNKPKDYHFQKYDLANKVGITLLQFWEPDIYNKADLIESMILARIGMSKHTINARKCIASTITSKELKAFCLDNHIQGSPGNNVKGLGLYHDGVLVSVLGYSIKKDYTSIDRYCSLKYHNVRGGFGKLLKLVPGQHIRTFSHNDISNGKLYKDFGFTFDYETEGDMFYTDYKDIFNRQRFMKSKIKGNKGFDESKTEIENMISFGYDVLYKSGIKAWDLFRAYDRLSRHDIS